VSAQQSTRFEANYQGAATTLSEWRKRKWLILVELFVVTLVFVADLKHFIPFSKTPILLV
jgi:hypothetical protein